MAGTAQTKAAIIRWLPGMPRPPCSFSTRMRAAGTLRRTCGTRSRARSAPAVAPIRNTARCLMNLAALCAGSDYASVMLVCRKLESWIWRARRVPLGDADPVSRLPRLPGQGDFACPFCQTKGSLRVRHATGVVVCLRPTCRDSEGNRPAGRVDAGSFSGEPMLDAGRQEKSG